MKPGVARDLFALAALPIAHRGLHASAAGILENTPSAVEAAIAGGYAIEVDLQRSADGEAMVFHDATLDRLTGERGPVRARSVEELKAVALTGSGDRIATLPELLAQVAGRAPLVIEIKSLGDRDNRLADRLAELSRAYAGPICAQSFDPTILARLREVAPDLPRGLISYGYRDGEAAPLGRLERFARRNLLAALIARPHFIAYDARALPAPAPSLARRTGLPLLSWTVRSQAEADRLAPYVDQIIFEGFRPDALASAAFRTT